MTSWQLTNAVAALLIPPGLLIVLAATGLVLLRPRPRTGRLLLIGGLTGLYISATPITAQFLLQRWEGTPLVTAPATTAQAIIILGGGKYLHGPEYGGDTVAEATLVRVRYAARLHRQTGLPVLVSGGNPQGGVIGEAQAMRHVLEREFAVPVRWIENSSATTLENARLSYQLLARQKINTIYLVTHAWHMPRAQLAFERVGFQVIPAATAYTTRYRYHLSVLDFMPSANALRDTARFCHEVIGILWYRVRLFISA